MRGHGAGGVALAEPVAPGQQRLWDVLEGADLALSPAPPSARQGTSSKQGNPGHQSAFAFQTQVECQTSVAPWLFLGSQAPSPHSPQSFALPSPLTLYLLPLLTACFHSVPHICSDVLFFNFLLHVYSLILCAPVSLGPDCVQSVNKENIVPELFTLFSESPCIQF